MKPVDWSICNCNFAKSIGTRKYYSIILLDPEIGFEVFRAEIGKVLLSRSLSRPWSTYHILSVPNTFLVCGPRWPVSQSAEKTVSFVPKGLPSPSLQTNQTVAWDKYRLILWAGGPLYPFTSMRWMQESAILEILLASLMVLRSDRQWGLERATLISIQFKFIRTISSRSLNGSTWWNSFMHVRTALIASTGNHLLHGIGAARTRLDQDTLLSSRYPGQARVARCGHRPLSLLWPDHRAAGRGPIVQHCRNDQV